MPPTSGRASGPAREGEKQLTSMVSRVSQSSEAPRRRPTAPGATAPRAGDPYGGQYGGGAPPQPRAAGGGSRQNSRGGPRQNKTKTARRAPAASAVYSADLSELFGGDPGEFGGGAAPGAGPDAHRMGGADPRRPADIAAMHLSAPSPLPFQSSLPPEFLGLFAQTDDDGGGLWD